MDRRAFLQSLIGGVTATAAVRTWPFRVFSFPSEIVQPSLFETNAFGTPMLTKSTIDELNRITRRYMVKAIEASIFSPSPLFRYHTSRLNPWE